MMQRAGPVSAHTLATGNDALILAHLAAGGQVRCCWGVIILPLYKEDLVYNKSTMKRGQILILKTLKLWEIDHVYYCGVVKSRDK